MSNQMRRGKSDKLARVDALGLLPEGGKVSLISGDEIVGAGGIGTLDKDVVVGIAAHLKTMRWRNRITAIAKELHELQPHSRSNAKLGPRQDLSILRQHRSRHVQPCGLGGRKQENGAL
jgi:hypothetical protein